MAVQFATPRTFRADPRPVPDRFRYREDLKPTDQPCNIVVDPRIQHGSTYGRRSAMTEQVEKIPLYPKKEVPRSADQEFDDLHRDGFSEALVQTDDFDGTVIIIKNEESLGIQTEPFIEKPIIHRKPPALRASGVRTEYQKTDLFDFNVEVVPIVTTLVQKAITQASMEVAEELELEQMRTYLRAFEQKARRDAEAIARLEEAEAKKFREKEQILAERRAVAASHEEVRAKVLARGFAEYFVWDLQEDVVAALDSRGYFYDEVERDVEAVFLPWLTAQTEVELAKDSVPDALAEAAFERAETFVESQCVDMEISAQIEPEQRELALERMLRGMIAEDIVAAAWRKSKQIRARQKKKKGGDGEEDEPDVTQSEATGSAYDSEA